MLSKGPLQSISKRASCQSGRLFLTDQQSAWLGRVLYQRGSQSDKRRWQSITLVVRRPDPCRAQRQVTEVLARSAATAGESNTFTRSHHSQSSQKQPTWAVMPRRMTSPKGSMASKCDTQQRSHAGVYWFETHTREPQCSGRAKHDLQVLSGGPRAGGLWSGIQFGYWKLARCSQ